MTILFLCLATGCAYHERVASVQPPPVVIGSINASTMRSGTRVIINLSEQRACLIERGKVSLISPIASGKPGWSTPTGNFSVISKDIDHRSQSFGSVVDGSGMIATSNATPGTYVPPGFHYRPAPMPYYMEFSQAVGMHAGFLPGYPASHGCVRMPRDLAARFFERVNIGTPVTVRRKHGEPHFCPKGYPAFLLRSLLYEQR
jgi:lipoprotein-anchoring transpeptidase ErfK/SrfK